MRNTILMVILLAHVTQVGYASSAAGASERLSSGFSVIPIEVTDYAYNFEFVVGADYCNIRTSYVASQHLASDDRAKNCRFYNGTVARDSSDYKLFVSIHSAHLCIEKFCGYDECGHMAQAGDGAIEKVRKLSDSVDNRELSLLAQLTIASWAMHPERTKSVGHEELDRALEDLSDSRHDWALSEGCDSAARYALVRARKSLSFAVTGDASSPSSTEPNCSNQ